MRVIQVLSNCFCSAIATASAAVRRDLSAEQNVARIYLDCLLLNFACRRFKGGTGPWEKETVKNWTSAMF